MLLLLLLLDYFREMLARFSLSFSRNERDRQQQRAIGKCN